jgi:AcrR family transcriptional regulator
VTETARKAKSDKTPRRKRISAEERQRRLIEAAVDQFSRRGFAGAATKQIADAAGVHEVLLYRDFGTKQGLYTTILDHKAKEARTEESLEELRALAEGNDDRAFVRCLVGKILDGYRRDPRYQRLMLYAALEGHEISRIFNETRGRPIFGFLTKYVEQRQKAGVFEAGDPRAIAFAMVGLPTYYAIVRRLFDIDALELPDEAAVETFTDLVLDGLRKRTEPGTANKKGKPKKQSVRRGQPMLGGRNGKPGAINRSSASNRSSVGKPSSAGKASSAGRKK